MPFDRRYEPCFVALVGALAAVGLVPRCVLEIPATRGRGERLLELISECGLSVHDLSRQASRGGYPRMNMPFEAGLACAVAWLAKNHRVFVLEERPYRLQRTLSDLSGIDPYIHGGSVGGVIRAVLEMFRDTRRDVRLSEAEALVAQLRLSARLIKRRWGGTLFRPGAFTELVAAAHELTAASLPARPRRKPV